MVKITAFQKLWRPFCGVLLFLGFSQSVCAVNDLLERTVLSGRFVTENKPSDGSGFMMVVADVNSNPSIKVIDTLKVVQAVERRATVKENSRQDPEATGEVSSITICEGKSTILKASIKTATGKVIIGTGKGFLSEMEIPKINKVQQYWNQTILTAAELKANGLTAGNIVSFSAQIGELPSRSDDVTNFVIKIGKTANTKVTGFVTTGVDFTTVYGPKTNNFFVEGSNMIVFDTPYTWDGMSNIIVDIQLDGPNALSLINSYYTETEENTTVSAMSQVPSSTTVLATSNPKVFFLSKKRINIEITGQVGTDGMDWVWTPGDLAGTSVTVSPDVTTAYKATGKNSTTGAHTEFNVTVVVNSVPAAPTGDASQIIKAPTAGEATVANLVVTGTAIVWYATEADAIANVNPLASTTQLVNGATYYAMQTVGGCRSLTPLAVTATVTLGSASFNMPGLQYYPNPVVDKFTVTYTNDITSVEVFNLVGQRVIAVQPNTTTALVDMSVLPTGAYILQVKANGQSQSIKVIKK